jgi:muramoyltetrapeptide carboxypeptidase LdcA involved in peptidoglycan recycling
VSGYDKADAPSSIYVSVNGEWTECELFEEDALDVTGRLIGGCIDVIDEVIGTSYVDLMGFADKYKNDGLIWFFDNFELTPMGLMYSMNRLKQMGLFKHAKAVIIGRTCFTGDATDDDYLEQLERVFGDMDVPLIWNADIGHTRPSFTLVNGAIGHLEFEDGYAELSMELM